MREHLASCSYCRFLVAQRREELEDLGRVWVKSARAPVIHLTPIQIDDQIESLSSTLLAAQGNGNVTSEESVTLASVDNDLLLRVVRDFNSHELWLYLVADDPATCQNVLVQPFGASKEYLTDSQGRVNLGIVDWPSPEVLIADVRMPKAVFSLAPLREQANENQSCELSSAAGDRIRVAFRSDDTGRHLEITIIELSAGYGESAIKVAVRGQGVVQVLQLDQTTTARVQLDETKRPGTLDIYLYQ